VGRSIGSREGRGYNSPAKSQLTGKGRKRKGKGKGTEAVPPSGRVGSEGTGGQKHRGAKIRRRKKRRGKKDKNYNTHVTQTSRVATQLKLELIQTRMIQKPLLWVEVGKSA
jgi:hypothetical protein